MSFKQKHGKGKMQFPNGDVYRWVRKVSHCFDFIFITLPCFALLYIFRLLVVCNFSYGPTSMFSKGKWMLSLLLLTSSCLASQTFDPYTHRERNSLSLEIVQLYIGFSHQQVIRYLEFFLVVGAGSGQTVGALACEQAPQQIYRSARSAGNKVSNSRAGSLFPGYWCTRVLGRVVRNLINTNPGFTTYNNFILPGGPPGQLNLG